MVDKITFMETLRSVAEITKTSHTPLSREEIASYFENMDLSDEQQEMVYQYLLTPQEEPEEVSEPEVPSEEEPSSEENAEPETTSNDTLSDSAFFKMYLEDINELSRHSEEEVQVLYQKLLSGDDSVIPSLSDHWLPQVIEIAKSYVGREVNMEDVIQEGNIGLLLGLSSLLGSSDAVNIESCLFDSIKESMERFIDEMLNDEDWETTMIGKATLVHEAIKALSEELGHTPDTQELCNYTKLSEEEIHDILELAKETK